MKLPSKEEIRRKYHIAESDFAILTASQLSAPESLNNEGTRLEKLGVWGRFEIWKKQSLAGNILAIIILVGDIAGGWTVISPFLSSLSSYVSNIARYTIVVSTNPVAPTTPPPTRENSHRERWAIVPGATNSITPVLS